MCKPITIQKRRLYHISCILTLLIGIISISLCNASNAPKIDCIKSSIGGATLIILSAYFGYKAIYSDNSNIILFNSPESTPILP